MIVIVELEKHLFANHLKGNLSCVVSCAPSFVTTFSDFEAGEGESSPLGKVLAGEANAFMASFLGARPGGKQYTLHNHLWNRYP